MDNLILSINAVVPIFLVLFLGTWLKHKGFINTDFLNISTKLVFMVALPALIFRDISTTNFKQVFEPRMILFALMGTLLVFIITWFVANKLIKRKKQIGAFVQGVFRSNYAIIGLPIAFNLFGQEGLTKSAILLAFIMPMYNIFAIIVLSITSESEVKMRKKDMLINILKNPLILAVLFALPFSYFGIRLPVFLDKTFQSLSSIAIPLALFGIGGYLSFENMKNTFSLSLMASSLKIFFIPLLVVPAAYFIGLEGASLGAVYILFASPTAVSSFIMAKAMGSDGELAANIVLLTTIGSVMTFFLGIFLLKSIGLF